MRAALSLHQLVLSGDFCQLPPVPDRREDGTLVYSTFAFEARTWPICMGKPVVLHQVFRQSEKSQLLSAGYSTTVYTTD